MNPTPKQSRAWRHRKVLSLTSLALVCLFGLSPLTDAPAPYSWGAPRHSTVVQEFWAPLGRRLPDNLIAGELNLIETSGTAAATSSPTILIASASSRQARAGD
jgi:hypothetical protein